MQGWTKDITGQKFGRRLVVVRRDGATRGRHALWLCRCRCGNLVTARGSSLTEKVTRSCGCLAAQKSSQRSKALARARRREDVAQ
jgi:hypothetical protein